MKLRTTIMSAILLAPLSLTSVALAKPAHERVEHKLTTEDARKIALDKVPGTVKHSELEKERGRWVYSIEIQPEGAKAGALKEVTVAADDGSIVAIEDESDDGEADDDNEEDGEVND